MWELARQVTPLKAGASLIRSLWPQANSFESNFAHPDFTLTTGKTLFVPWLQHLESSSPKRPKGSDRSKKARHWLINQLKPPR